MKWMNSAGALMLLGLLAGTPALPATGSAAAAAAHSCQSLVSAPIGEAVGAHVAVSAASERSLEGGHYCVVEGTIDPAIRFEARLPIEGWSGRYLQTGCGGLCG